MSAGQRRSARRLQKKGIPLGPIASLWAYFVSHSVSFLIPHGRMGWVLPGSLVDADYGEDLLKKLAQRFSRVVAIKLQQRCFAHVGTDESSVVLLCEDLLSEESTGEPNVEFARDVAECAELIDRLVKERATGNRLPSATAPKTLDSEINLVYRDIQATLGIRRLGEVADVKIGVVTGANRFFLVSRERADELGWPSEARQHFFTRFYQAPGVLMRKGDIDEALKTGEDCCFLDTREVAHAASIKRYLNSFPKEERDKNRTFEKHEIWHQPQLGQIPHGFLSYMHDEGPRLVVNEAGVLCTNSIHRIFFKAGVSAAERITALVSTLSTLGQFCAEIEGRSYGSGVLKIEPSEAKRILIASPRLLPLGKLPAQVKDIDRLLRAGKALEARAYADACVLAWVPALKERISVGRLGELLTLLRIRRSPHLRMVSRRDDGAAGGVSGARATAGTSGNRR